MDTQTALRFLGDPFASTRRPVLRGELGAVSAAHPLAVAAGQEMLLAGGSAADAAIAAQAVLCVLMPDACGLGGDVLALLHRPGQPPLAVNGAGAAPAALGAVAAQDGGRSVCVPGLVAGWCDLARVAGRLPLARLLAPAVRLAADGMHVSRPLASALRRQRERLLRGGACNWALFDAMEADRVRQPALATLLQAIGADGRDAFYGGAAGSAIVSAVNARGGCFAPADLAAHVTVLDTPVGVAWGELRVHVQPPMTQGVLLAMAVGAWAAAGTFPAPDDHVAIELTQAAFAHRDDAGRGAALLDVPLTFDPARASRRGGPRSYLHTAGVAVADRDGQVVSSLVSVFDDFGSCVYVPELGLTLNNRAGGFTAGANAPAGGKRPVHTLAPMLLEVPGGVVALATPGADGQVQTLLQVLVALRAGHSMAEAIARPRWRSEDGRLLVELSHPEGERLRALGHDVVPTDDGDLRFGAVVCAGHWQGQPVAGADWRRETTAGVV